MALEHRVMDISGEMRYCVVGPKGAVDFHFQDLSVIDPRLSVVAGIEEHRREPADWQKGEPAAFDKCWLLDGPCWCDGSSLYAIEHLYPLFKALGVDGFWAVLEAEYRNRFERTDDEDDLTTAQPGERSAT